MSDKPEIPVPEMPLTPTQVRKRYADSRALFRAEKRKELILKFNEFLVRELGSLAVVGLELDRHDYPIDVLEDVLQLFKGKGWRFTTKQYDGGKTRIEFIEPPQE